MATKKRAVAIEERRLVRWKCPECGSELNASQMELQPKVCTSCGEGDLDPVYETPPA